MRISRSIRATGVGVGIVAVGLFLAGVTGGSASAANVTGGFSYGTADSPSGAATIKNPTLERCYPTKDAADGVNETNLAAQVFKDGDCKDLAATLRPGESNDAVTFASVKFTDHAPNAAVGTPIKPPETAPLRPEVGNG
jgi:hypothetical protein